MGILVKLQSGSNHEGRAAVIQVPKVGETRDPLVLCELEQIPEGGAIAVDITLNDGETTLIVLRNGDQVQAYHNVCPHAGRRLDYAPGKFLLKRGVLVCAVHGASFRAESGLCIGGPCCGASLSAVPVAVQDGRVVVHQEPVRQEPVQ